MARSSFFDNTLKAPNTLKALKTLMDSRQVWRASGHRSEHQGIATGYQSLDKLLVDGGWPLEGLTEILYDQPGVGEFRLLAPALAKLSQTQNRWLLWVAPPYIPYAPALTRAGIDLTRLLIVNPEPCDQLWVLEKALASSSCSAVMAWADTAGRQLSNKALRRLQVASKNGQCLGFLYRQGHAADQPSPAELRLRLYPGQSSALSDRSQINFQILKRRGGWATELLSLELNDQLNEATPDFSDINIQQRQSEDPDLVYMEPTSKQADHVYQ